MIRPLLRQLIAASSLLIAALVVPAAAAGELPAPGAFPHHQLTDVLSKYVDTTGLVAYADLAKDRAGLDAYTALLAKTSPDKHPELFPTRDDQLAYWLNAYNAEAITGVIDQPGIKSVHDNLTGFFYLTKYKLGGKKITLYKLENGIVRKRFSDARVHMALNCQSIGCPRLPQTAFEPATLDAQLDAAAAEFCANPAKVKAEPEKQTIHMSQIFEWYADDFKPYGGQIAFCNQHGQQFDPSWAIEFIPYDWSLMTQPGKAP